MNNHLFLWLFLILLSLNLLRLPKQKWFKNLFAYKKARHKAPGKPTVMHPSNPNKCPACRAALLGDAPPLTECPHATIIPWDQIKGIGGPKKTISTDGFFCPNPACTYFGVTDPTIHAIAGDGKNTSNHGPIQDLCCQACQAKFSARRHTPLYRLKSDPVVVCQILALLANGDDPSTLAEIFNVSEATIRTWLSRSGDHGRKFHDLFFVNLELSHLQLDELWGYIKRAKDNIWIWTVLDAKTKIMPVLLLGPRNQDMANAVVHQIKSCLRPGCVPVFSSDGLRYYYYALTAHFGEWVELVDRLKSVWLPLANFFYAQVIKHQRAHHTVEVEQRNIWGSPDEYQSRLKAAGLSGRINTAFVERANLTIRQCVSKLTRRTWGTAHYVTELAEHLYWWQVYYHFVRYHESLRIELSQPIPRKGKLPPIKYRSVTPAMAAGLTQRRWSVLEIVSYPLL
jgi:IS1 family transposase